MLAACAAFATARLVERPSNPEALLWWLGIAAVGMAALHLVYGVARRARAFAALLGVTATFPSRPPSRAAIAWEMPDALQLRHGLDELAVGAWTTEVQSRRAALVAALWALDESTRHPAMLWRPGDGDVGVRMAEGDIPGLLQLLPRPSIRHRTVTAAAGLAAVALLLSSVALGVPSNRSSQLADRGRADVPTSSRPGGPVTPVDESPSATAPVGFSGAVPPAGTASAAPSSEPPATAASVPTAPASSSQPQPALEPSRPLSSRRVLEAEAAAPSSSSPAPQVSAPPSLAPLVPVGGLVALVAPAPTGSGTDAPIAAVAVVPSLGALLRPAAAPLVPVGPATVATPGVVADDAGAGLAPAPSVLGPSVLGPSPLVRAVPAPVASSPVPSCAATAGVVASAEACVTTTDGQPPVTGAPAATNGPTAPSGDATATAATPTEATPKVVASNQASPDQMAPDNVVTTTPTDVTVGPPADQAGVLGG